MPVDVVIVVPVIVVDVIRSDGQDNVFSFYDSDTANQVATLFERAAALCGVTTVSSY